MRFDPVRQGFKGTLTGCYTEDNSLLFINRSYQFVAVHGEKQFHRRMGDSFVPINEAMPTCEEVTEGGSFPTESWKEFMSSEGLLGLDQG